MIISFLVGLLSQLNFSFHFHYNNFKLYAIVKLVFLINSFTNDSLLKIAHLNSILDSMCVLCAYFVYTKQFQGVLSPPNSSSKSLPLYSVIHKCLPSLGTIYWKLLSISALWHSSKTLRRKIIRQNLKGVQVSHSTKTVAIPLSNGKPFSQKNTVILLLCNGNEASYVTNAGRIQRLYGVNTRSASGTWL